MRLLILKKLGGSPGLVVMVDDSGYNLSTRYWMDIFHIDLLKNCIVCLKRPKINEKRPGIAHGFKKY